MRENIKRKSTEGGGGSRTVATLNVSMPEEMKAFVDKRGHSGSFSTPSEYIRHLVRLDMDRVEDAAVEEKLLEAVRRGKFKEVTPEFWERLHALARGDDTEERETTPRS